VLTNLLEELAREAPSGGDAPGQLWRRGRRVARTQRLGTVAITAVACVLLIGLGSVTWQQRAVEVPPADDAETGSYLPSRFHPPSPWLPGTDPVVSLGPLIATYAVPRKSWFGSTDGLVGVSAGTGAYAFLDLPHAAPTFLSESALAPDGRHVAYWTTGSVPDPVPDREREGETINGYAVYDTITGKVVTQTLSTERGIGHSELIWFDTTHLGVEFGQMQDCCSSIDSRSLVFDLISGRATGIDVTLDSASTNAVGSLISVSDSVIVKPDGSTTPVYAPSSGGRVNGSQFVALSPDAKRTAAIVGNGVPGSVYVKDVNAEDFGYGNPISGKYMGVFCWLDETHLAALRRHGRDGRVDLVSIDVQDGSAQMLSEYVDTADLALNLIGSPVRTQPAPPRPWSPWVSTVAVFATLTVAARGILLWRRRVRA
jgi:hypothetical protein